MTSFKLWSIFTLEKARKLQYGHTSVINKLSVRGVVISTPTHSPGIDIFLGCIEAAGNHHNR